MSLHEDHMMKKQVEVNCDSDEECDTNVSVFIGDDAEEQHEMHMQGEGEGHKIIMIKKHVVIED